MDIHFIEQNEINLPPGWVFENNFEEKGRIIGEDENPASEVSQGHEYRIISKAVRHLSASERIKRTLVGLAAVISSIGLALLSRTVRELFVKSKEEKWYATKCELPVYSDEKLAKVEEENISKEDGQGLSREERALERMRETMKIREKINQSLSTPQADEQSQDLSTPGILPSVHGKFPNNNGIRHSKVLKMSNVNAHEKSSEEGASGTIPSESAESSRLSDENCSGCETTAGFGNVPSNKKGSSKIDAQIEQFTFIRDRLKELIKATEDKELLSNNEVSEKLLMRKYYRLGQKQRVSSYRMIKASYESFIATGKSLDKIQNILCGPGVNIDGDPNSAEYKDKQTELYNLKTEIETLLEKCSVILEEATRESSKEGSSGTIPLESFVKSEEEVSDATECELSKPVLSDEKPANEEEENTPKVEEQRLTREDAAIERMRVARDELPDPLKHNERFSDTKTSLFSQPLHPQSSSSTNESNTKMLLHRTWDINISLSRVIDQAFDKVTDLINDVIADLESVHSLCSLTDKRIEREINNGNASQEKTAASSQKINLDSGKEIQWLEVAKLNIEQSKTKYDVTAHEYLPNFQKAFNYSSWKIFCDELQGIKNKVSITLENSILSSENKIFILPEHIRERVINTITPRFQSLKDKIDEVIAFDKEMKQVFEEIEGGLKKLEALSY